MKCSADGRGRIEPGQENAGPVGETGFPALILCEDSEEDLLINLEVFEAETELHLALGREGVQVTAGAPPGAGQMILANSGHGGGRVQRIIQVSLVLGVENNELRDVASVEVGSR